jgi:hypothetical protein
MNRFITGTNVLLVILVAIGSFSLSYSALSDLASKNGFTDWRAYVLPLVIDIGMLAFGLAVVHAHLHSTNPLRRRGLNLLYTGVTVAYNLIHAPNNLTAQGLAVIPPLTLFFTFEVLMAMVEYNIKRNQEKATITGYDNALSLAQKGFSELMERVDIQGKEALSQQKAALLEAQAGFEVNLNRLSDELAERDSQISELQKRLEVALDPVKARREDILIRLQSDNPPTQKELAEIWGVTTQTIQTDIKALNGSIAK